MLPDRVSNPGTLTYESGALPIALRGPAPTLNTFKNQIDKFIGEIQYTVFPENSWVYIREGDK